MTPNELDIIGGRWSGLRAMADAVNRQGLRVLSAGARGCSGRDLAAK
jgi:hypothetical protein